jgi:hypothetical protein
MECHGNNPKHCCWLGHYGVCGYVEENTVEGRRWACQLLREKGTWARVYKDRRYRRDVKPKLVNIGVVDCGDWPQNDPASMASPTGKCCFQEEVV